MTVELLMEQRLTFLNLKNSLPSGVNSSLKEKSQFMNGTPLRTNSRYSCFLLISGIRRSYLYNQAWWDFHSQHRTCKYSLVRDLGMYHQHMGQDWGNRQCLRKKEIKRGFNMGGSRIYFLAILVQNI